MAFQNAAKKDQARLRRPTPSLTGDGIDDLTLEQKIDNLLAVEKRYRLFLTALKGAVLPVDRLERAQTIEKWEQVKVNLKVLTDEKQRRKLQAHKENLLKISVQAAERRLQKVKARALEQFIIDVIRKDYSDERWNEIIRQAKFNKENGLAINDELPKGVK